MSDTKIPDKSVVTPSAPARQALVSPSGICIALLIRVREPSDELHPSDLAALSAVPATACEATLPRADFGDFTQTYSPGTMDLGNWMLGNEFDRVR